jgi:limonene-1,2-epoxide hydrolase
VTRFGEAFEARDLDAIVESLAPDVVINSPISRRVSFRGREEARRLFEIVLDLLGETRYTHELADGDVRVVVLHARLAGRELHEVQLMRLDGEGRVKELTLFMRPLPGITALAAALGPRLTRRKGRLAAAMVAAYARPLAVVTEIGDRVSTRLV